MLESNTPETSKKRKKILIAAIGGAAALVIAGGAIFAVQNSVAETNQRCADAVNAARSASAGVSSAKEKAGKVQALAAATSGYSKSDGADALMKGVGKAVTDAEAVKLGASCSSQDEAQALTSSSASATSRTAQLDDASAKLSSAVTAFQEAEKKRVADAKEAAEKKEAAAKP